MAVREWLRMKEPDFCYEGILILALKLEKCVTVIDVEKWRQFGEISDLYLTW